MDEAVRQELLTDIREKKIRLAMSVELDRIRAAAHVENYLAGTFQSPEAAGVAKEATARPSTPAIPASAPRR